MQGAAVDIAEVSAGYDANPVLRQISLSIAAGEFFALLGPSGCGKSTLLRTIAGFEPLSGGSIEIAGRSVAGLPPKQRGVAMAFQSYALYPHMTVRDNIATPLVMRRLGFWQRLPLLGGLLPGVAARRGAIADQVEATANLLELDGLLNRLPAQLSGGQRQRVALARALAPEPSVLLLDEPLSNLDARLRTQTREELSALHRRLGITFIYVTHDQIEAMTMAQRIGVLMDGRLVQVDTPARLYAAPAELRVAQFIGAHPINVFEAVPVRQCQVDLFGLGLDAPVGQDRVTLAIRPEDIALRALHPGAPGLGHRVVELEDHGADLIVRLVAETGSQRVIRARVPAAQRHLVQAAGQRLSLLVAPGAAHFFGADDRRLEMAP
jgi:multiple sugar transport system ATP-binding protein